MAKRKNSTKKTKTVSTKKAAAAQSVGKNKKVTTNSLKKWNIILASLLALEAVLLVVFSKSLSLPVNLSFLTRDSLASQAADSTVYAPAIRHLFDINLVWLLALILVVGAAVRLSMATFRREKYEADLKNEVNKLRWVEYTVVGGLSVVVLGLVNGIYDLVSLIAIFAVVEIYALFCLIVESNKQIFEKHPWAANKLAILAFFVPWIALAFYLFGAQIFGATLPGYVYWLDATILIGFIGYGVNMILHDNSKKAWSDYLFTERSYLLAGFAVQTALVWQIFFGALR